ncbi:MAG TPA: helix-turn-helix domain-containing protein, partial [Nocardioides sp.]
MTLVDTLRRFNRTYTQRVGALEESHLGTGRTLGASRLLFEVDRERGSTLAELRDLLGLDSGYLARLLRGLEADGLVATESDPADRRRRRVVLTVAGRAARDDLDRRSDDLAARL